MLSARYIILSHALILFVLSHQAPLRAETPLGLVQGSRGTVLQNGQRFRGIGVNYYNCFVRTFKDPNDTSYDEGFRVLAKHKVPFARFSASGFWPRDMKKYVNDRKEYFRRLDGIIRSAEQHGIGLIPSFFWNYATVPDLVGEPMDQWGNPDSKTHAFMRDYVRSVVTRYRGSPAIWAWEFGNEFNLHCNLPNAADHRPFVAVQLGTPSSRSADDDLTYDMFVTALHAFAIEVRRHDAHRLITSGDAMPRPSAWHNRHDGNWSEDSADQFAEILQLTTPHPVNLISVHCYASNLARIEQAAKVARVLGKPLFVGEFQIAVADGHDEREAFRKLLAEFDHHDVALAAVWVFDYDRQERDFNITADNSRAWQLELLRQWNGRARRP